ncbi:MAG: S9 family peptidase [Flavobacteriales bacterium]|jgi:dipeptidyl aminopeptidase/acylaminoacyl peptidase|nr:S9 family peptidase [Flavobacteriales bacterium]MBT3963397.1 S9 family peptidase [Flavobacteriales bacterium]MBT4704248.1 S9 family peptidase [Flavobacteriales bacterium]MBT4930596.1 S9 family peptidase [Flavobacteriales bacterium]MBT5131871.1 S9 family peptidase [Flavobacteriales bacterium]
MRSLSLLFSILISCSLLAQDVLSPENLWKLKRVYGEQVSPDGKSILFIQKEYNLAEDGGTSHLMMVKLNGNDPNRISDGEESIGGAQWRPDGKKIGYLSSSSGSNQLWEMNPDGSDRKQVTSFDFDIGNWSFAPDMKHISFTYEVKIEESLLDKYEDLPKATGRAYNNLMFRHWTEWHDYTFSHVAIASYSPDGDDTGFTFVDIMKNEQYDSPLPPFGGGEQIVWKPDGSALVYVCKKMDGTQFAQSTNSDIYLYSLSSGETRNLTEGMMGYDNDPVFSPSGTHLAWMSMKQEGFEADKNDIIILDMKSGTKTNITSGVDQTFGHIVWANDHKNVYALSPINATYQAFEIGLDKSVRAITSGTHNVNSISLMRGNLIGTKSTMSHPNELFLWTIEKGEETQLSSGNKELISSMNMGKVEKRMIKTNDDKDMLVWVIYPPDFDPNKKYPTLLYCQGGPQSAVSQFFSFRWNFQLMASQGYIVVAPNRRGLPSFGQKWNDDISKDWGGQAMRDYLSAIDEVAKEPFVDNDRLGAIGASYGGYSVYYLAGIHEGRFKTFISHCGLYNLESWYASTEELFFANWDIGGPYWASPKPESYLKFSPHSLVHKWDTPILVIHNELDFRVPLNQGLEAFTAAQLRGVPSKLLYYPDEGHWVLKPQNGVMWHREFYGWLDKWLK